MDLIQLVIILVIVFGTRLTCRSAASDAGPGQNRDSAVVV